MLPEWMFYMAAVCFASFCIGWIIAWALDEWRNR